MFVIESGFDNLDGKLNYFAVTKLSYIVAPLT
jgi:hypothetical protein